MHRVRLQFMRIFFPAFISQIKIFEHSVWVCLLIFAGVLLSVTNLIGSDWFYVCFFGVLHIQGSMLLLILLTSEFWLLFFCPSIFLSNLLGLLFCSLDKAQVNLGEFRVLYSWHCFMFLYEFSSGYILSSKTACASMLIVVDWSASYWDTCKYLYESVGRISCSYAYVSWWTSFVREQIKHRMKLVVCSTGLFPLINCLDTVWCFVWWFLGLVDGGLVSDILAKLFWSVLY